MVKNRRKLRTQVDINRAFCYRGSYQLFVFRGNEPVTIEYFQGVVYFTNLPGSDHQILIEPCI